MIRVTTEPHREAVAGWCAVKHGELGHMTDSEVRGFVECGPVARIPSEGVFTRTVFESADGVFALGSSAPVRYPVSWVAPTPPPRAPPGEEE